MKLDLTKKEEKYLTELIRNKNFNASDLLYGEARLTAPSEWRQEEARNEESITNSLIKKLGSKPIKLP